MKEIMRRLNLGYLRIGLLSLLTSFTLTVFAQNYSEKPVRLIVPFPPGGATDVALNL
jgi:tripartite-type tricarboxylate transporter receptor subunit TctC